MERPGSLDPAAGADEMGMRVAETECIPLLLT